jgi:pilus assembly protein CpaC
LFTRVWTKTLSILIVLALLSAPTQAASGKIIVQVSRSVVINADAVEVVAIANPDIADVLAVSDSELMIVGKAPGVTTLQVWAGGIRSSYSVEVSQNDPAAASELKGILDYPRVKVAKTKNVVLLEGFVDDQYQKARAEKIAGMYGEKVINLIEVINPKQIKIEAKIIEISKDHLDKLGVQWGNDASSPGTFDVGQSQANSRGQSLGWFGTYAELNARVNALIQSGNAKVLSQPNVVTISGEKANILIGGEIPIPVSMSNGQVSVEWKEYGIKFEILPEVNSEKLIVSRVKAEVSSLDYSNPNTMVDIGKGRMIPALRTRKAETVIALPSGQSMAIGGLIATVDSRAVSKLPVLGDLPVLGKLFQSSSFTSGQTELVIMMTPTLISAYDNPR